MGIAYLLPLGLVVALASCGGAKDKATQTRTPACTADHQCEERFRSECPGGSVPHAVCRKGTCELEGCSSPIGTPCDDDPSTQFDDEDCPE